MKTRERSLWAFLKARFTSDELLIFVSLHFHAVKDGLPGTGASLDVLAHYFLMAVVRHGQIPQLFRALAVERPSFTEELAALEKDWQDHALPVAPALKLELSREWARCAGRGERVRASHKLLVLMCVEPGHVHEAFDAVDVSLYFQIRRWLREQATKSAPESGAPSRLDDDATLAVARTIAVAERATSVDARHYFIALLADKSSNTIRELGQALDKLKPGGFEALRRAAQARVRPQPSPVSPPLLFPSTRMCDMARPAIAGTSAEAGADDGSERDLGDEDGGDGDAGNDNE